MSLEKMSFESKNYKRILREDLVKNLGLGELTGLHIDQSQTYHCIEDIMLYPWTNQSRFLNITSQASIPNLLPLAIF